MEAKRKELSDFDGAAEKTRITENFCYTNTKLLKCSLKWTIDNFSLLPKKNGEFITSTEFSAEENNELKWVLLLYPNGTVGSENDLCLFLKLIKSNKNGPVKAKFIFSIRNDSTTERQEYCSEFSQGTSMGFNTPHRSMLYEKGVYLPGDKLTIICEVSVSSDTPITSSKSEILSLCNIPESDSELAKNIGSIFDNMLYSDVALSVDGRPFKAHKTILAARSPVFAAMFKNYMEESNKNLVVIDDIDSEVFDEILRFIYTGKVSTNVKKIAKNLFYAADKYLLKNLKIMCEMELCNNYLTVQNAVDTLSFANLHGADQLKAQTIHFIDCNLSEVMKTSAWRNNPCLVPELFQGK